MKCSRMKIWQPIELISEEHKKGGENTRFV